MTQAEGAHSGSMRRAAGGRRGRENLDDHVDLATAGLSFGWGQGRAGQAAHLGFAQQRNCLCRAETDSPSNQWAVPLDSVPFEHKDHTAVILAAVQMTRMEAGCIFRSHAL